MLDDHEEDVLAPPPEPAGSDFLTLAAGAVFVGVLGAGALAAVGFFVLDSGILNAGQVVVPRRAFAPGEMMQSGDLELVPLDGAAAGTSSDLSAFDSRIAASPILEGEPILEQRLGPAGRKAGATSLIPKGRRAMWMGLEEGAAGLGLEPGDHVDLWATTRVPGQPAETIIVAEGVEVVALEAGSTLKSPRATLAATPEQMAAVTEARKHGTVHVVLRSDLDFPPVLPLDSSGANSGEAALEAHAARALAPGKPLEAGDLVLRHGTGLGASGFASVDELVGSVPHRLVFAGERVVPSVLADPTVGRGMSALLRSGERAISLSLGDNPTDLFPPGSTLDVKEMVSLDGDGMAIAPLQPDVPILGIHPDDLGCPCVILVVNADTAGPVLHARAVESLVLALPETVEEGEEEATE